MNNIFQRILLIFVATSYKLEDDKNHFIRSHIHLFTHSFIYAFIHLRTHSFMHLLPSRKNSRHLVSLATVRVSKQKTPTQITYPKVGVIKPHVGNQFSVTIHIIKKQKAHPSTVKDWVIRGESGHRAKLSLLLSFKILKTVKSVQMKMKHEA